jgi:hypothetical protein
MWSDFQSFITIKTIFSIFTFASVISIVFSFLLANFLSRCLKKNIRPDYDECNISISPLLGAFPLVALVVFLPANISPIFYGLATLSLVAPLIAGMSLVHFLMNNIKNTKILLLMFYLLFFLMPILTIFVILLGIIDAFYAIRPLIKNQITL